MQGTWLIGVDEVGRGPLAGPVGIGVVKIPVDFDWKLIPGVGDSKKVSKKKREVIFDTAKKLQQENLLDFRVELIPATYIDTYGISAAIRFGLAEAIKSLALSPEDCFIKLDGSLKAPAEFQQETIIRGDATEPVIGLASIMAKVTRDAYMVRMDLEYPLYAFSRHKGYGTKAHCEILTQEGLCPLHRVSYCQKLVFRSKL